MHGQCLGTAAWLVGQGLIAAESFKQSSGKWVTVGRGDTQTQPEQGSLWGCHLHSRGTKASSVPSAKLLVRFPCAPHPSLRLAGAPGASARTRQHKPPRSHQEPSLHLKSHHFPL